MRFATVLLAAAAAFLLPLSAASAQQFCGGPAGGNYDSTMSKLSAGNFHAPAPKVTKGSGDNLDAVDRGECVAAPAQLDAALAFNYANRGRWIDAKPVAVIGEETAHLVCADYTQLAHGQPRLPNITDLAGRRDITIAIGQDGSGSQLTWTVLTHILPYLDPARGGPQVNTSVDPSSNRTLQTVKSTATAKLDCLFFVSTPNSDTLKRVDSQGASLELVGVNDPAIFSARDGAGQPIYEPGFIPVGTYPNLQSSRFSPFYGQTPVASAKVKSVLFTNTRWYQQNPSYAQWVASWASSINATRR